MSDLFQNITLKNREKVLKLLGAHTMSFPKNTEILADIYSDSKVICLVDSGTIQILKNDYDGNRNIIEELHEGEIFGLNISFILGSDYEIITKEVTTITVIDFDNIMASKNVKFDYYIDFLKNLLKIMGNKTLEKNERIEILSKRSIRDKILEYFKIEAKHNGTNTIYLPFTFTDLADYLAVDRSAMTRELKYLKEEGFIIISGKRIKLNMYIK